MMDLQDLDPTGCDFSQADEHLRIDANEAAALEKFKGMIPDVLFDPKRKHFHHDAVLLRFLRARQGNAEQATLMLKKSLVWRDDFGADTIVERFPKSKYYKSIMEYWPAAHHGTDRLGNSVYIERMGLCDPQSILDTIPEKELIDFHVYIMEVGIEMRRRLSEKVGKRVEQTVLIQDCTGLGWKHFSSGGLETFKKLIEIDDNNYPETMRKLFVINAPTLFTALWRIIKPWLSPLTASKVIILGTDWQSTVDLQLDVSALPECLGGKDPKHLNEAGIFGTSFPKPTEVDIVAGKHHHHEIHVTKPKTTIAWEFQVLSMDVEFSLYEGHPDKGGKVVHPAKRYDTSSRIWTGMHRCDAPGVFCFRFNNSYSMFRSKKIKYRIDLLTAEQTMIELDDELEKATLDERTSDETAKGKEKQ